LSFWGFHLNQMLFHGSFPDNKAFLLIGVVVKDTAEVFRLHCKKCLSTMILYYSKFDMNIFMLDLSDCLSFGKCQI
jgi:hypothetical protein